LTLASRTLPSLEVPVRTHFDLTPVRKLDVDCLLRLSHMCPAYLPVLFRVRLLDSTVFRNMTLDRDPDLRQVLLYLHPSKSLHGLRVLPITFLCVQTLSYLLPRSPSTGLLSVAYPSGLQAFLCTLSHIVSHKSSHSYPLFTAPLLYSGSSRSGRSHR
jgi:hypothetical protein